MAAPGARPPSDPNARNTGGSACVSVPQSFVSTPSVGHSALLHGTSAILQAGPAPIYFKAGDLKNMKIGRNSDAQRMNNNF